MNYFKDLLQRLRSSLGWVAAQYVLTLVLLLLTLAWTRLPDKHVWQVAFSLLVPVLLAISAFELEAGTMRALSNDDGRRVKLVFGAVALVAWAVLLWACWEALDWCDDQIPQWAGYLNSRGSAGGRSVVFTYNHFLKWMTLAEWILRWIIVPGKIIPYSIASAQWGWRIPFRRIIRLLLNWRWWLAVVPAAMLSVLLPGHFFASLPQGTVSHQIWSVALKLVASYALIVGCWIVLLTWAAVLLEPGIDEAEQDGGDDSLVPVPVGSEPLNEDSVRLPLPESGDNSSGNA
jgi:hypothetical protein